MKFDYNFLKTLIDLLKVNGYAFCFFGEDYCGRSVILRHDVDFSVTKAYEHALFEQAKGVNSTYFFLLRTDFYNPLSAENLALIRKIGGMGHRVGLHFDSGDLATNLRVFSEGIGMAVTDFSFHRPAPKLVGKVFEMPGFNNAYSPRYIKEFKYLSDSRRAWRENPFNVVETLPEKLCILTHPIWYATSEIGFKETLTALCGTAAKECFAHLKSNIRELEKDLNITDIKF